MGYHSATALWAQGGYLKIGFLRCQRWSSCGDTVPWVSDIAKYHAESISYWQTVTGLRD